MKQDVPGVVAGVVIGLVGSGFWRVAIDGGQIGCDAGLPTAYIGGLESLPAFREATPAGIDAPGVISSETPYGIPKCPDEGVVVLLFWVAVFVCAGAVACRIGASRSIGRAAMAGAVLPFVLLGLDALWDLATIGTAQMPSEWVLTAGVMVCIGALLGGAGGWVAKWTG